ncbi:unnamed protein product [Heterosigma akashiwo]
MPSTTNTTPLSSRKVVYYCCFRNIIKGCWRLCNNITSSLIISSQNGCSANKNNIMVTVTPHPANIIVSALACVVLVVVAHCSSGASVWQSSYIAVITLFITSFDIIMHRCYYIVCIMYISSPPQSWS